jgi:peptide chain release factor 1
LAVLQVGQDASHIFKNESGGHRWQHAPTGKVHTSTITVAVMDEPTPIQLQINPNDLDIITTRGSGNGGQKRNKTDSCVVVTHKPTKTSVRCEAERSQHQNRELAIKTLRARLWADLQAKAQRDQSLARNAQILNGGRRRTIQVQNNIVKDEDGRKWRYEDYRNGKWKGV